MKKVGTYLVQLPQSLKVSLDEDGIADVRRLVTNLAEALGKG